MARKGTSASRIRDSMSATDGVERRDLRQMQLEHEAMRGGHPPVQRLRQLRPRGVQPPRRQVRQPLRVGLPGHAGVEDGPPTRAENVADHFRQADKPY